MRVLHVVPGVAPRDGGPTRMVYSLGRALRDRGVDVGVVTTDADGTGRLDVPLGEAVDHRGVETVFFRRQLGAGFKYSRPLARWLKANAATFDLLHVHAVYSHSSFAGARTARSRGVPYVLRPLGSLSAFSQRNRRMAKLLLWHLYVRRMLRDATALLYMTEHERRLAERLLGSDFRGVVVPPGIELPDPDHATRSGARWPGPPGRPYVLVLSRIHPVKGLELFVRAFLDATRDSGHSHWHLVIAGSGEAAHVDRVRGVVERHGGADRVSLPGWLSGAAKEAALAGAELLAQPSLHENFGLSVLEGMAHGRPVLVTEDVGLSPVVERAEAGWVVQREAEKMADTLKEVFESESERRRRGEAARQLARETFSWDRVADLMLGLYERVLSGHTR